MSILIEVFYTQTALEFLLSERYLAEFEVIDGLNQHPEGLNFYDWLGKKGIIPESEVKRINTLISLEEQE